VKTDPVLVLAQDWTARGSPVSSLLRTGPDGPRQTLYLIPILYRPVATSADTRCWLSATASEIRVPPSATDGTEGVHLAAMKISAWKRFAPIHISFTSPRPAVLLGTLNITHALPRGRMPHCHCFSWIHHALIDFIDKGGITTPEFSVSMASQRLSSPFWPRY
jgi:hypothetical protein